MIWRQPAPSTILYQQSRSKISKFKFRTRLGSRTKWVIHQSRSRNHRSMTWYRLAAKRSDQCPVRVLSWHCGFLLRIHKETSFFLSWWYLSGLCGSSHIGRMCANIFIAKFKILRDLIKLDRYRNYLLIGYHNANYDWSWNNLKITSEKYNK